MMIPTTNTIRIAFLHMKNTNRLPANNDSESERERKSTSSIVTDKLN